jgi:DNA-binding SARP family transcriptional activator/Tfp pilus assembly protein PilF
MEPAVEFGLLGPLLVRSGGANVPVPPGNQRTLLAALLLDANQMVSQSRLTEILWGNNLPASARPTLQNYVKRLRKAVQETGSNRIRTLAGGYLICADASELDVLRFETLHDRAREAARDGAWDRAAEQLSAALALWRGEPLADVSSELLVLRDIPRLTEMRLQAIEARIEARLQLGRHAAELPELRQLTFAHPLRERLHCLLMLALYRDGQQADALAAYQRARRFLIEEVGAEPGPELRRLERQILAADPALAWSAPAGTSGEAGPLHSVAAQQPRVAVPRQLPAPVRHFTGRTAEIGALASMFDLGDTAGLVITAISGAAGVGKTALAVQWAHQIADQFPDGQLYVNLRGHDPAEPMAVADALAVLLRGAGVPGHEILAEDEERAAQYRSLLAGRRILVLLDNAASAEQVRLLLPGTPGSAALITSRDALAALIAREGAQRLVLELLPMTEAVELLRALIGARADAEPKAIEQLAFQCARLPLALRVAAELVTARPAVSLSELADELADQQQRLDLLDAGGDPRTAVRAVFSWSCRHLSAGADRAFRLLGLHPGADFDAYAAAALTGATISRARQLLDDLARVYLIQPAGPGRHQMHDLLTAYAAEQAAVHEADQDRRTALTRLFDYYLYAAAAAMDVFQPAQQSRVAELPEPPSPVPPLTDAAHARAWLDAHRAILIAAAEYMADNGWPAHATRLSTVVFRYLEGGGYYAETIAIYSHSRRAARDAGDLAAEAEAINNATVVDLHQGRYQQAGDRLREALILYRQVGDQLGQARALGNLGIVDTELGRYREAGDHHELALALYQETGDQIGAARTLNNLGLVDLRQGRYQRARGRFERSLTLSRQIGGGITVASAMALANLGICELRLGGYPKAASQLRQALAQFRECGFPAGQALALTGLGAVHGRQGQFQQAGDLHRQALALCREAGDRSGEAGALNSLGEMFLASGEPDQARQQLDAALSLAISIGDRYEQTRALNGLGETFLATGEIAPAREQLNAALNLAASIGELFEQARALDSLARGHREAGDPGQARRCWRQALALYTAIGVPEADLARTELAAAEAASG